MTVYVNDYLYMLYYELRGFLILPALKDKTWLVLRRKNIKGVLMDKSRLMYL